jgi:hypothetical protein
MIIPSMKELSSSKNGFGSEESPFRDQVHTKVVMEFEKHAESKMDSMTT